VSKIKSSPKPRVTNETILLQAPQRPPKGRHLRENLGVPPFATPENEVAVTRSIVDSRARILTQREKSIREHELALREALLKQREAELARREAALEQSESQLQHNRPDMFSLAFA